ncbi:MAG: Gfo/Idh/MocA family oxidoreductase [Candidatus Bathyarchaeia archaeon]
MAKDVGFIKMAAVEKRVERIPEIGVGILGYAFMGKAHSHAYIDLPIFFYPPPARPILVAICGRNESLVSEASKRYGFKRYYTSWKHLIEDNEVELFDNCASNDMHAEPCIAAAEAGKHIFCEKPLATNAKEAKKMLDAVNKAKVKHMVGFNYRFVPAVRLAKKLIEDGRLGRIYHFRARYLQEWIMDPQFPLIWKLRKEIAGSGPLGDLGSHIIDLARFLIGDVKSVSSIMTTFIKERPLPEKPEKLGKVNVEDAFVAAVEFENGAVGTLEATRFAAGRKNFNYFEINGERGSIEFNLERLNEIRVYGLDETNKDIVGWREILVTESHHPFIKYYWPHGHIIGWEHTFLNEIYHFIDAIVNDKKVEPYAATFDDGYKCNAVMDAIMESAEKGKRVTLQY